MIIHNDVSTPAVAATQPVNHLPPQPQPRTLKLALDVHLVQHVVAMQYDGEFPKPPQRFYPKDLLTWVEKHIAQGWRVISCYEAGPFGYVLHRQLTGLGATNYVIRPRNWDDQHQRVKTDRTDARAMLNALDRFVAGNPHALALVRVPTETQERRRSESRLRQSLRRDLKMIVQRGRGLGLQYGYRLSGKWYGQRNWPALPVPPWLIELLTPLRTAALALHEQVRVQTMKIEAQCMRPIPKGLGQLTEQILSREVGDWTPFQEPAAGGQLSGVVSQRTQFGAAPPARQRDQVRQSQVKMGLVRSSVEALEVSTGVSAVSKVARTDSRSPDTGGTEETTGGGAGARFWGGLVALVHGSDHARKTGPGDGGVKLSTLKSRL